MVTKLERRRAKEFAVQAVLEMRFLHTFEELKLPRTRGNHTRWAFIELLHSFSERVAQVTFVLMLLKQKIFFIMLLPTPHSTTSSSFVFVFVFVFPESI